MSYVSFDNNTKSLDIWIVTDMDRNLVLNHLLWLKTFFFIE